MSCDHKRTVIDAEGDRACVRCGTHWPGPEATWKERYLRMRVAALCVAAVVAGALALALTPESADRIIERAERGRLVFLSGYMQEVEGTTVTIAQKWGSVKKVCGLLAEQKDIRAVVSGMTAQERVLAKEVLRDMNTDFYARRRAELTAAEDEITSGL